MYISENLNENVIYDVFHKGPDWFHVMLYSCERYM